MLIDDQPGRSALLEQALKDRGLNVVTCLNTPAGLMQQLQTLSPDVIIVDVESPDRDTLEHMATLHRDNPHPVVMFCGNRDTAFIERAMRAGVSAYVVDGLNTDRVRSIVDVAIARFREYHAMRRELEKARNELADRKLIDRAKGLLMNAKSITEQQAYSVLRKMAMDGGQRIADVAKNVITVLEVINKQIPDK